MEEEVDERMTLNYDCNYNLLLAKRLFKKLTKRQDKKLVVQWLKYLMTFNKTIPEMELRNDFLYYLVLRIQEGSLLSPFDSTPPNATHIKDLAHLIPDNNDKTMTVEEMMAEINSDVNSGSDKPLVMEKSPDGGAFLALQPMPRDGAFAYLTISTKGKAKSTIKQCPI